MKFWSKFAKTMIFLIHFTNVTLVKVSACWDASLTENIFSAIVNFAKTFFKKAPIFHGNNIFNGNNMLYV